MISRYFLSPLREPVLLKKQLTLNTLFHQSVLQTKGYGDFVNMMQPKSGWLCKRTLHKGIFTHKT